VAIAVAALDFTKDAADMIRGGIEHRAAKVSLVTGLSTILSVAFQLIAVPVCLKYWGQETYGSWLALFAAFMLLRSLDAGYVAYVGNKLNYLYHQDKRALREHLSSAIVGIVLIVSLQLLLVVATLVSDRLAIMLGMTASGTSGLFDRLGLLVLMVSWVLTGSYLGIVHRLLIPAGLMYQAAWWSMGFQVSQFVAIMAASLLRLGMLQTSILFALSQLVVYVASAVYIKQKLPTFYPWWQGGRMRTGLHDLCQSSWLTASSLIQQGATNGVVLLVSALAGPAAVPVFTTVRTLTNLWTNVTNVLTTPLLPDVVRLHAKGEAHKLVPMNEAYWVLVGSIVNWGVLLSYPLLSQLYGYWTGHILALDKTLLCLLLGSVVVTNAGALMAMHLNGINSLRIVFATSLVRGVLGLGVGFLTYAQLGLAGFGLGILSGEVAALLMTGRFFMKYELADKGFKMPIMAVAPAVLGTSSVLLFLVIDGFGWMSTQWAWPVAMAGVMTASIWGWNRLDPSVKARLVGLLTQRFTKKGIK
jgi:O-antigen/teichoic acid export membrane protein